MVMRFAHRLEESVLSFLLVFMTLLVFLEVILRFGFNTGIHWAQEVTLHTSAWFVLFGISYGVRIGAHIGVDAVVRLLQPNTKRIVSIIACLLCLVYCGLIIYGAWGYLDKIYTIGLAMEDTPTPFFGILSSFMSEDALWEVLKIDSEEPLLPMWIAHGPLLIGFILLTLRFLEALWKLLTGQIDTMHMADEAKEALEDAGIEADALEALDQKGKN